MPDEDATRNALRIGVPIVVACVICAIAGLYAWAAYSRSPRVKMAANLCAGLLGTVYGVLWFMGGLAEAARGKPQEEVFQAVAKRAVYQVLAVVVAALWIAGHRAKKRQAALRELNAQAQTNAAESGGPTAQGP